MLPFLNSNIRRVCPHPHIELSRVPRLHENRPGSREFTDQAFATTDARNDATTRYPLHNVFAIPRHQVTVVDDVLFTFDELRLSLAAIDR